MTVTASRSHMLRTYSGEATGNRLALWLNKSGPSTYGTLVGGYLSMLLMPGLGALWYNGRMKVRGKLVRFSMRKLLERYLQREQQEMRTRARVARFNPSSGDYDFTYLDAPKVQTPLHWAFALYKKGLLERVKLCRKCSKWFYARFRHQKYCSQRCQQAEYRSGHEWKAHRAEYMRDYRRTRAKLGLG